jgi:hypothetical protein
MLLTAFLGVTLFSGWLGWIIGLALVILGLWVVVVIFQLIVALVIFILTFNDVRRVKNLLKK